MALATPKLLVLFSTPLVDEQGNSFTMLDVAAEREAIIKELEESHREIVVRFDFATVDAISRGLKDHFNILHFSGHGSKEYLAFEDGQGGCQLIDGKFLKKLIGITAPFDLAIISACYSESIATMVNRAGVRHVVAVRRNFPILDLTAIKFAGTFYRQLLANDTIQHAFDIAQVLVEGDPQISKVQPHLEAESCGVGEHYVSEEKKFVLIPRNKPSFHQIHNWYELPAGNLIILESKIAINNLPVRPLAFRGRAGDIHQIIGQVLVNRLVTITGVGGIGKTTVSIETARWFHLRNHFPDGVFLINLKESANSNRLIDLFGVSFNRHFSNIDEFISFISNSKMLFLLDNAEDLLFSDESGLREKLDYLLKFAPEIKILVTSQREIGGNLHEAEKIYRMGIMNFNDSKQLFLVSSKRPITHEEISSKNFRHLMNLLGGHPLSIVIVSKQLVHGTTIEELSNRIEKEKAKAIQLKGDKCTTLQHGESLIASILTSYNNLDSFSKELFIALSLFPAGAFRSSIISTFGDEGWNIAHKLNDASLCEMVSERVVLLPAVRLFAEGFLTDEIRQKYEPKILRLLASLAAHIYRGYSSIEAAKFRILFTLEEPNLRNACKFAYNTEKGQKGQSYYGILTHFLLENYRMSYKGYPKSTISSIVSTLERINDIEALARVMHDIATMNRETNNFGGVEESLQKALELFRSIKSQDGVFNTSAELGLFYLDAGNLAKAKENLENALEIAKQMDGRYAEGRDVCEANAYSYLSDLFFETKDLPKARENIESSLKIHKRIEENISKSIALVKYGTILLFMNDLPQSKETLQKAADISKQIGAYLVEARALLVLGSVLLLIKDLDLARTKLGNAQAIYKRIGDLKDFQIVKGMLEKSSQLSKKDIEEILRSK